MRYQVTITEIDRGLTEAGPAEPQEIFKQVVDNDPTKAVFSAINSMRKPRKDKGETKKLC